ncbi:MAG: hypothetical protein IT378_07660, partial [Sandaracinaceae bacterium]|nr:hypothetical protein [Sandaracinaceae bacterium]
SLVHYSLTRVAPLPPVSSLELTGLPNGVELISAADGSDYDARLSVCQRGTARSLVALLVTEGSFTTPTYYRVDPTAPAPLQEVVDHGQGLVVQIRLPPAALQVEGLDAALDGNLDPLAIRVLYDSGVVLLGHAGFLALARGRVSASAVEYTSIYVTVGGLREGDVFRDRPCHFGESLWQRSFQLATATFEVGACTFLGGGETFGYRIHYLAVTDTNAALTPAEQQRIELAGEPAVDAALTYRWNHHNGCDSFHLALPHADYAATASPLAGCGLPVPEAPPRDISDPDRTVLYRIRYHGGAWTDGVLTGCHHYLLCTP